MKKALSVTAAAVVLILVILCGGLLYLYHHPEVVIHLIETELGERTRMAVQFDRLEWSANPLQLTAENIRIASRQTEEPFEARIARLQIDAHLSGGFTRRRLVVETLALQDFAVRLTSGFKWMPAAEQNRQTGPAIGLLNRLARVLLFDQITLEQVDLSRGDIRLALPNGRVHLKDIAGSTDPSGRTRITGNLLVEQLPLNGVLQARNWKLALNLEDPNAVSGEIVLPHADLQSAAGSARLSDFQVQAEYDRSQQQIALGVVRFIIDPVQLVLHPAHPLTPGPLLLNAKGTIQIDQKRIRLARWDLRYRDTVTFGGDADIHLTDDFPLQVSASGRGLSSATLQRLLAEDFALQLPVTLQGPLNVDGRLQASAAGQPQHWDARLTLEMPDNAFAYKRPDLSLSGLLKGRLQITDLTGRPALTGQLHTRQTKSTGAFWNVAEFNSDVTLAASHPLYRVEPLTADLPRVVIRTAGRDIQLDQVRLNMPAAELDVAAGIFSIPKMTLESALLSKLNLTLTGNRDRGRARIEAVDAGLPAAAGNLNIIPAGWSLNASDRLALSARWQKDQPLELNGSAGLSGLRFANADESCIGENLAWQTGFQARIGLAGQPVTMDLETRVDKGEVLCGRYYLDFGPNRLAMAGKGVWEPVRGQVQMSGLLVDLQDLMALQVEAAVPTADPSLPATVNVKLKPSKMNRLFRHFILEPYRYERPLVKDISLAGTVTADMQLLRQSGRWSVLGDARWVDGAMALPSGGLDLAGINLRLPVWYDSVGQGRKAGPLDGHLQIEKMSIPFLADQSLDVGLQAEANHLRVQDPTRLALGSGSIVVGPLDVRFDPRKRPGFTTSVTLQDVPVSKMAGRWLQPPPSGTIRGHLDPVIFDGKNLSGQGSLRAKVFGGEIRITDPGIERAVSATPAITLDAAVQKLDLAQLTGNTGFGRIQGVLSGLIEDLVIVGGEPQQFDLRLETVGVKGVPQRINVQAVENIARLGGGTSPFAGFAGTFAALFKTFPYKKIGVAASLQNDVFKINGTIKENDTEYLVRRSGLSGVDVVNLNPDNRISFKDMLKRIQRIDSPSGGPVVR